MALRAPLSRHVHGLPRVLSSNPTTTRAVSLLQLHFCTDNGNFGQNNSFESADDFERHLFGDIDNDLKTDPFYGKLDKIEKVHGRSIIMSKLNGGGGNCNPNFLNGKNGGFDYLSDGMDGKLKRAAPTFVYSDELHKEEYKFRPDVTFRPRSSNTSRDLDLSTLGVRRSFKRNGFETTTEEVLKKADFRNVRFLTNFLTEAGIIIKRSQTRISAKAQRKVAREIKTARAFGLMPFTTMGKKPFVFGKNMKDENEDYEFDDNVVDSAADC